MEVQRYAQNMNPEWMGNMNMAPETGNQTTNVQRSSEMRSGIGKYILLRGRLWRIANEEAD